MSIHTYPKNDRAGTELLTFKYLDALKRSKDVCFQLLALFEFPSPYLITVCTMNDSGIYCQMCLILSDWVIQHKFYIDKWSSRTVHLEVKLNPCIWDVLDWYSPILHCTVCMCTVERLVFTACWYSAQAMLLHSNNQHHFGQDLDYSFWPGRIIRQLLM